MATLARLNVFLGLEAKRFSQGLNNVHRRVKRFGRDMDRTGKQLTSSLTVPIAAAGTAALKMATDFSESMERIEGLVGVQRSQVNAWRGDLLSLSTQVGKVPRELGEGMFFVTSAGLRGSVALDALKDSAMGSAAGLGETATVADAVTSAMNAYGPEVLRSAQATSILVAAVREGKAAANTIAPALGRVIPIASDMGVEFHEVAASIAAMTRIGSSASESVTYLRGVLNTIQKPAESTRKGLAAIGLPIEEIRRSLADDGLLATLFKLKEAIALNNVELSEIFPNTEAITGALALTGKNAAETAEIFESLANTTEKTLHDAFEVAASGPAFKLKKALAGINVALIRLGDAVLPVVIPIIESVGSVIKNLADEFATLPTWVKQAAIAVAGLAAAAGPVMLIVAGIATGIAAIGTSALAWGAAVAAAGAGIVVYWDKVKVAAAAMIKFLKPAWAELRTFAEELLARMKRFATEVWPDVLKIGKELQLWFRAFWIEFGPSIKTFFVAVWEKATAVIKFANEVMLTNFQAVLKLLTGDWKAAVDLIKNLWEPVSDFIWRHTKAAFLRIGAGLLDLETKVAFFVGKSVQRFRQLTIAFLGLPFVGAGARVAAVAGLKLMDSVLGDMLSTISENERKAFNLRKQASDLLAPLKKASEELVQMEGIETTIPAAAAAGIKGTSFAAFDPMVEAPIKRGINRAIKDGTDEVRNMVAEISNMTGEVRIIFTTNWVEIEREMAERGMQPDTAGTTP
ncbi:MAG: phage tail tape measure protein [bacterium]|nr:phage tail tape measure protein [bacterium]